MNESRTKKDQKIGRILGPKWSKIDLVWFAVLIMDFFQLPLCELSLQCTAVYSRKLIIDHKSILLEIENLIPHWPTWKSYWKNIDIKLGYASLSNYWQNRRLFPGVFYGDDVPLLVKHPKATTAQCFSKIEIRFISFSFPIHIIKYICIHSWFSFDSIISTMSSLSPIISNGKS